MFGLSEEHDKFQRTNKCPNGHWILPPFRNPSYVAADGTSYKPLTPYQLMDRSTIAECPVGHERWPVFAVSDKPIDAPEGGQGQPTVTIVETQRAEEEWYVEDKVVDNTGYGQALKKTIQIKQKWTQDYVVERENTQSSGITLGVGPLMVFNLEHQSEQTLRRRYEISEGQERTYATTEEIPVAAYSKVYIYLHWKRQWQHGLVVFGYPNGAKVQMPFKVAVGLDYDLRLVDG